VTFTANKGIKTLTFKGQPYAKHGVICWPEVYLAAPPELAYLAGLQPGLHELPYPVACAFTWKTTEEGKRTPNRVISLRHVATTTANTAPAPLAHAAKGKAAQIWGEEEAPF
jgi:hypothetical protein